MVALVGPGCAARRVVRYAGPVGDEVTRIVEQLRAALAEGGPRLRLALLFGSAAKGKLRADSDLDVGIVPADPALSLRGELELAARLGRATGREVDIVRLDEAPAILRFEVARDHILLAADPPAALPRFLAEAALDHAEMKPLWDDARRRLARRLAQGAG